LIEQNIASAKDYSMGADVFNKLNINRGGKKQ